MFLLDDVPDRRRSGPRRRHEAEALNAVRHVDQVALSRRLEPSEAAEMHHKARNSEAAAHMSPIVTESKRIHIDPRNAAEPLAKSRDHGFVSRLCQDRKARAGVENSSPAFL